MQPADVLLRVKDVGIRFGGLKALEGLSFEMHAGELMGLIGPNGAGKTTAFNILSGVYTPTSGEIQFLGQPTTGLPMFRMNRMGLARTFQNIRLFSHLSVLENVLIAQSRNVRYRLQDILRRSKQFSDDEVRMEKDAKELLDIFSLSQYADHEAGSLPYGKQRLLEIVRALATKPRLLLLDEPAAGMNPTETKELMVLIERIRKDMGIGILLIEHDMKLIMGVCERIVVLDHGEVIALGNPESVRNNARVIEAYLGVEETELHA